MTATLTILALLFAQLWPFPGPGRASVASQTITFGEYVYFGNGAGSGGGGSNGGTTSCDAGTQALTFNLGTATSAGDHLDLWTYIRVTSNGTVTDSGSQSYTKTFETGIETLYTVAHYHFENSQAGVTSVVYTPGSAGGACIYQMGVLFKVSSTLTLSEDAYSSPTSTLGTSPFSSASITTSVAKEWLTGCVVTDDAFPAAFTSDSPWTHAAAAADGNGRYLSCGYQITSASGSKAYSGTGDKAGSHYSAGIVAYK